LLFEGSQYENVNAIIYEFICSYLNRNLCVNIPQTLIMDHFSKSSYNSITSQEIYGFEKCNEGVDCILFLTWEMHQWRQTHLALQTRRPLWTSDTILNSLSKLLSSNIIPTDSGVSIFGDDQETCASSEVFKQICANGSVPDYDTVTINHINNKQVQTEFDKTHIFTRYTNNALMRIQGSLDT